MSVCRACTSCYQHSLYSREETSCQWLLYKITTTPPPPPPEKQHNKTHKKVKTKQIKQFKTSPPPHPYTHTHTHTLTLTHTHTHTHTHNQPGKETKSPLEFGLHSDVCKHLSLSFGVMIETAKLCRLIPVLMSMIFHSRSLGFWESLNFCNHFFVKFSVCQEVVLYAVEMFWIV